MDSAHTGGLWGDRIRVTGIGVIRLLANGTANTLYNSGAHVSRIPISWGANMIGEMPRPVYYHES